MVLSDNFRKAAIDYFYLTQKGYPPRGFIELVGNRYGLTKYERTMLYRGIAQEFIAEKRRQKIINIEAVRRQEIFIDGFNVILTISSYLQGLPLFLSNDGFLRDASMMRGKIQMTNKTRDSVKLIFEFLVKNSISKANFLLDKNIKIHPEIIAVINELQLSESCKCEVHPTEKTDKTLSEISSGIVCTSDSGIIDSCKSPVFDLAFHVIQSRFHPHFLSLQSFLDETV
jgi:hypothetical protein